MNGYERYMAMVKGGKADCVPRLPILMGFAADFIGSDYAAFASDHRVLVEANRRCVEFFGFDQLSAISDPYRETSAFGAQLEFVKDAPPRCIRHPLESEKDLSLLRRPDPATSPRMRDRVQAVEELARFARGRYSILGWIEGPAAEAADLRGVTNFLMDSAVDAAFSAELMDLCVEVGIRFAVAQLEAGADTIGIGDAVASQVSPATYEQLVLPREARLVEAIHDAGSLVRLHICGDITHLLPHVAVLGADIVDLDWMVDMGEARRVLGRKTALTGNLDPVNAVLRSTPEKIREGFRRIYAQVGDPYCVGAGCEVPIGTPPENLKALCEPIAQRRPMSPSTSTVAGR